MRKRGSILRDTAAGPGLLMVEGQQYPFTLEGVWRSEIPPKPGLTVEIEFDHQGQVAEVSAISDAQLAREQVEAAGAQAKNLWVKLLALVGLSNVVAAGALLMGWFLLPVLSIQTPFLGKLQFTFWQLLGILNSNNPLQALSQRGELSSGFYGFLALIALVGPFVPYLWKDKRATLGGVLPLVFMLAIGLMVRSSLLHAYGGIPDGPLGEIARQARDAAMQAVSLGFGAYISLLASLYFAATGAKQFLAARTSHRQTLAKQQKAGI